LAGAKPEKAEQWRANLPQTEAVEQRQAAIKMAPFSLAGPSYAFLIRTKRKFLHFLEKTCATGLQSKSLLSANSAKMAVS